MPSSPLRCRVPVLILALLGVLSALVAGGPGAAAAPYTPAASIAVSSSNPCQGAPVTLTGVGYVPGSIETITIGASVVGRPVADASGNFTITITLAAPLVGQQTVTVVGPSGGRLATTQIVIERCGNGGTDPGGSGVDAGSGHNGSGTNSAGVGGLSTTGVAVFGLLGVAVLLVLGGAVLTLGGRRRRAVSPSD